MGLDFSEKALLRAEVRLSMTEAELLSRSLRWVLNQEIAAARDRNEEGPSLQTLQTVEGAAAVLEGATLLEAAKRSEEAWTGDAERDRRRAEEEMRRDEEEAERELGEAGVNIEKMRLLDRAIEGVREGRDEFSTEEIGVMRRMLNLGKPSSNENLDRFLREWGRPGENN